ncbi:MAG: hypothetical protein CYPHOPRED_004899 [Cyphobasidiales sp. Tagirdzhanova-0007]|nr:MAG: hypothetical protein CYPHOPRED_004899 [Cyphobasidiales sp. Tagirdzhanova-0007]
MECLRREYGQHLQADVEGNTLRSDGTVFGWDVSLKFDMGPEDVGSMDAGGQQEFIKKVAMIKRYALGAPFERAFTLQKQLEAAGPKSSEDGAGKPSEHLMAVHYREEEAIYVIPSDDRVTVIFSTVFREETDRVFGKVFLQEFYDARRLPSIQSAPQVLYSNREPPSEIRHLPGLSSDENIGYITFAGASKLASEDNRVSSSVLEDFRNTDGIPDCKGEESGSIWSAFLTFELVALIPQPRARRASRAPLGKSHSVDDSVLSSTQSLAAASFGRPSSMLARVSSSASVEITTTNALAASSNNMANTAAITQKMKASSLSSAAGTGKSDFHNNTISSKIGGAVAPRRVLGDLSNTNKVLDNRGGKDGSAKDGKAALRVRSATSTNVNSKPLAPKSSTLVSNPTIPATSHSRSTSAASRHSILSQKSSHSSLHAVIEVPGGQRRSRTHSENTNPAPVPGAPRIGTGNWQGHTAPSIKSEDQYDGEVLDTVVEGDSFSDRQGLGINFDGQTDNVKREHSIQDEVMDDVAEGHSGDTSNETFELDLDAALEDSKLSKDGMQLDILHPSIPEYEDEYAPSDRREGTIKSPKSTLNYMTDRKVKSKESTSSQNAKSTDPTDWLANALKSPEQREAERMLLEAQKDFRDEIDFMDTSMVAEYSEEIFKYMEELEIESMPNPNYMESQTEIEWPMRATLIDWLLQVHMRYHMLPETLWITINIVDRFLSNRIVSLVKLQLVGITAMFVAAKYEEIMAPSVDEFVYMTESNYSREEILKGERIILASLDFKISNYCSPYSWVRRISKADDYDIQTRTLSKFLMEVTLLDHRFLRAKPSMIAAVGMYLARRMLGGDWSNGFIFYSKYTESHLATPTSFLLSAIAADDFEERFVYQKYSSKKFLKASIFARQWAQTTLESATRAHELMMK